MPKGKHRDGDRDEDKPSGHHHGHADPESLNEFVDLLAEEPELLDSIFHDSSSSDDD